MSEPTLIGEFLPGLAERILKIQEETARQWEEWSTGFNACDNRCRGNPLGKVSSPHGEIPCPHLIPECWAGKLLEEEKKARIISGLKRRGVGAIYLEANFANSKPTRLINRAKIFFNKGNPLPRCLILSGGTGCGKTHAAVVVLRAYLEAGGEVAYYFYSSSLLNKIRFAEIEEKGKLIDLYAHCPFLVIDDLGTESKSEFGMAVLDEIIHHREQDRLPTIITTNKGKDEWKAAFGERIGDRLLGEWGMGAESGKVSLRKREEAPSA